MRGGCSRSRAGSNSPIPESAGSAWTPSSASTPRAGAPVYTCGPCSLNAFDWLVPVPVVSGNAEVRFPMPCNPGLEGRSMQVQWIVGLTASSPCSTLNQVSFSDRLSVTFGF